MLPSNKWITALRKFNAVRDKDVWSIPRKNTEAYSEVKNIIKTGHARPVLSDNPYETTSHLTHKQKHNAYLASWKKLFENLKGYYTTEFSKITAKEKQDLYSQINEILYKQSEKDMRDIIYREFKEDIDSFAIPSYAKKGYDMWLKKNPKK